MLMLYLKYECANFDECNKKAKAKEIKAITMQFLQEQQSNIPVYISYAMALNKLEGYKSANKVFDLAFQTKKKAFDNDLALLYLHAAKLELKHQNQDKAMWYLALLLSKRPHEPCTLGKLDLLAFANEARSKILSQWPNFPPNFDPHLPILPKSPYLSLAFGLGWLNYLLDGLDGFSNFLSGSETEIYHQLHCDVLKYGESGQKSLKKASLAWISSFPRSANALGNLSSLNVQTAVSSAFWRSLSASLLTSKLSPIGHLTVIKILIQQFKFTEDHLGHLYKAWSLLNEFVKSDPCRNCVQIWRLFMWTTKMLSEKNPYK